MSRLPIAFVALVALVALIALAWVTTGAAMAQVGVDARGFDSSSQVYRCLGGARLAVVYLNIKGGDSFATAAINGHLVLMKSGPTGSGARYVAVDERPGYIWHVKGDLGNLYVRAADPAASQTLVLQDCKAQRQPS